MSHLGGHVNTTNLETGSFIYLNNKYNLKSFLDIGYGNYRSIFKTFL